MGNVFWLAPDNQSSWKLSYYRDITPTCAQSLSYTTDPFECQSFDGVESKIKIIAPEIGAHLSITASRHGDNGFDRGAVVLQRLFSK